MMRLMRIALVVLLMPMAAAAQNTASPGCAEVAKDIDKYADQEVSFYGKVESIAVRDGVIVIVFACKTERGDLIPEAYFGITLAPGADSIPRTTADLGSQSVLVTGVVRGSDSLRIFSSPPAFRGPYLYRVTIKPGH
jgi:hypothetical protein